MREIKFRVWDNIDWMSSPFTFSDIQSGKIGFVNNLPVMQYTGFKDSKGVEIYEGDILKRSKESQPTFVAVIEFSRGCFGGATYPERNHWIEMPRLSKCDYDGNGYDEVIGNIYQNPDLLTKTQPQ